MSREGTRCSKLFDGRYFPSLERVGRMQGEDARRELFLVMGAAARLLGSWLSED